MSDTPSSSEQEGVELEREFTGTTDVQMPSGTQIHQEGSSEAEVEWPAEADDEGRERDHGPEEGGDTES